MRFDTLDFTAPGLFDSPWNEAEVLGSAVWLWMHSPAHSDAPLHSLSALLLPALKHKQFILACEQGKPVFYLSWLNLSAQAQARYLCESPLCIPDADWNSGDCMWIHDWVAPFGHTRQVSSLLQRRLLANRCARALYHRGEERGLRVKTFQGIAVMPTEARAWFAAHPLPSAS